MEFKSFLQTNLEDNQTFVDNIYSKFRWDF